MSDEKATPAAAAPAKADQVTEADLSPEVKEEVRLLRNLEGLLKRVKGLEGDEAFAYVEARQYIAQRAAMITAADVSRVRAEKAAAASKANGSAAATPSAEAPAAPAAAAA